MFKRRLIPRVASFVQISSERLFDILPEKGMHYHFLIARYTWENPTIKSIADRYQVSRYRVGKDLRLAESLVLTHILTTEIEKNNYVPTTSQNHR